MKTGLTVLLSASLIGLTAAAFGSNTGYVAHEWGTFTSVQAADGVQMAWNPLSVAELPDFVYSLSWPQGKNVARRNDLAAKAGYLALQRMETPVIYFYADEQQSVNVSVNFPKGLVTEWYPQATRANSFGEQELKRRQPLQGEILWQNVNILSKKDPSAVRLDRSGSHYYAARETDANLLRLDTKRGSETERFLFYRGVASFQAPLKVTQQGDSADTIELRNSGSDDLRSLFVYQVQGDRAAWALIPKLPPGESASVQLQFQNKAVTHAQFHDQVTPELRKALAAEGLFDREAAAMVKTWDDSWFAEQGLRVLYILPRQWTDETLPLTLTPAARQIARVMVGRAELITPAMETTLLQEMSRYAGADTVARAQAVENVRKLGLGRFSEAVMRRILTRTPVTPEFSNRAWELLQAVNKAPDVKEGKQLAQN
jgi:hypothetical protein